MLRNRYIFTVNKAVKKSYADDEMKEESLTDSITSSYGIGPTDEKGMPLFGLKALRRQNKSTPEVQPDFTPYAEEQSPRDIKDSSGRPLFGLKALQISKSSTVNCEENQTSESSDKTLKDLVNRHDKHARKFKIGRRFLRSFAATLSNCATIVVCFLSTSPHLSLFNIQVIHVALTY